MTAIAITTTTGTATSRVRMTPRGRRALALLGALGLAPALLAGGVNAAQRADAQCGAARRPGGGWFEYPFPKPGEERPSRKITYMLAVPGTPYVVGAGVYDETLTLEQLQAVSGEQR